MGILIQVSLHLSKHGFFLPVARTPTLEVSFELFLSRLTSNPSADSICSTLKLYSEFE